MSTEIDELEKRVAILEERISAPRCIAGHDPTGDGSAYQPEPAPGSDAEHPPVGYVLVPSAPDDRIKADWLVWAWDRGPWESFPSDGIGYARNRSRCAVCRPIPANEGDSRLAESVAIPVGWKAVPEGIHREIPVKIRRRIASGAGLGLLIYPDPSIPWGEGYEAILPSEATEGDEYWSVDRWWKSGGGRCHPSVPGYFAWRRRIPATTPTECDHDWRYASRWTKPGFESCARCQKCDARKWEPTTPTESARDLSAEVEKKAESLCIGCKRTLCGIDSRKTGGTVTHCANRMLCDSERIASLVLDKSRLTTGMMELRATVERLEAENAKLRKDRDQYRKELEELEAKLDGIKELAG